MRNFTIHCFLFLTVFVYTFHSFYDLSIMDIENLHDTEWNEPLHLFSVSYTFFIFFKFVIHQNPKSVMFLVKKISFVYALPSILDLNKLSQNKKEKIYNIQLNIHFEYKKIEIGYFLRFLHSFVSSSGISINMS